MKTSIEKLADKLHELKKDGFNIELTFKDQYLDDAKATDEERAASILEFIEGMEKQKNGK